MREGHELLYQNDGLGLARCGPVLLIFFSAPPTVERLENLVVVQRETMKNRRSLIMTLIDPGVGKEMTSDARRRAGEIGMEMEPYTLAQALVVLGDGFFGALVRSVITGVQMFAAPKHPWKVVGDVEAGIAWSQDQLKRHSLSVDRVTLHAAAAELLLAQHKPEPKKKKIG